MAKPRNVVVDGVLKSRRKTRKMEFKKKLEMIRELEALEKELQTTLEMAFGQSLFGGYSSQAGNSAEAIYELEEPVFVFTDIQDSTMMAAHDPTLYK